MQQKRFNICCFDHRDQQVFKWQWHVELLPGLLPPASATNSSEQNKMGKRRDRVRTVLHDGAPVHVPLNLDGGHAQLWM